MSRQNSISRFFIVFISLLLLNFPIYANPLCKLREYRPSNELTETHIADFYQDRRGFIWMATRNGLCRYDGRDFLSFRAEPGNNNPQSTNRVVQIAGDSQDNIWCVTYDNRLYRFDTQTSLFVDVLGPIASNYRVSEKVREAIYSLPESHATWVVLHDGSCVRFDDYDLSRYDLMPNAEEVMQPNETDRSVYQIYRDTKGGEWILTSKGIFRYGTSRPLSDYPFSKIVEVAGRLFFTTSDGYLAEYSGEAETVKFMNFPQMVRRIYYLGELNETELLVGTDIGLFIYDAVSSEYSLYHEAVDGQRLRNVSYVYADRHGQLWVYARGGGVYRIAASRDQIKWYPSPDEVAPSNQLTGIYVTFEDTEGNLWIKPKEGSLSWYDPDKDSLVSYEQLLDLDQTKPEKMYFNRFLIDAQKNLWVSSSSLIQLSFKPRRFKFAPSGDKSEVRAIFTDTKGNVWYGDKSGYIYCQELNTGKRTYLTSRGKLALYPEKFCYTAIYALYIDTQNHLWVGTRGDGLYRVSLDKKDISQVEHFKNDPNNSFSLSDDNIYAIYEDERRHLWIGTYGGGLNLVPIASSNPRFYNHRNRLPNYPAAEYNNVRCITGTRDGVILVGTTDGLITFTSVFDRPAEIIFYKHNHRIGDHNSLPGNDIRQIVRTSEGKIIVCAYGLGVSELESGALLSDSLKFATFLNRENPGGDVTLSAQLDQNDRLWMISEHGISCYYPDDHHFEYYDRTDFDRRYRFTEAVPEMLPGGEMLIGVHGGLLSFHASEIRMSSYEPNVVFTGIAYSDEEVIPCHDIDTLYLPKDRRDFSVLFAALDFHPSTHLRYAYKMDDKGVTSWNQTISPVVNFANLSGGHHRLMVRSTNHDGVWSEKGRELHIFVEPTFWETSWSWLLYFLIFAILFVISAKIYTYIYVLRHKMDMERKISELKLKYFTDISHELRTPLTLISGPLGDVLAREPLSKQARQHLELAQHNTSRMINLVNQILDFRKIQGRHVRLTLKQTDVVALLARVKSSFDDYARTKNITYTFSADVESMVLWLDKDKVEKVLFNLLSNAFKYTDEGKSINLSLVTSDNDIKIVVADQGRGIAPAMLSSIFERFVSLPEMNDMQPSSGIGLSLVKELLQLHHAHIDVESVLGEGSRFIVTIERNETVYKEDPMVDFVVSDSDSDSSDTRDNDRDMSASESSLPSIMPMALETEPAIESGLSVEQKAGRLPVILVVEDNEELRRFIVSVLSSGYRVREASNGKEGLEIVKKDEVDFVLTDVMMPEMDGMEMVRQIKSNPIICHVPIVVLSAKSSIDDRISGLEHGIDDYIVKPFSATYLRSRVDNLLHQRKMLQQAFMASCMTEKETVSGQGMIELDVPQVVDYDKEFVSLVMAYFEQHMSNTDLSIDDFAAALNMSRTSFYRKVKSVLGMSPSDFIRQIRIRRAVQFINAGEETLSQIAYKVGFSDPKYFSKCFKRDMGMPPQEYKQKVVRSMQEESEGSDANDNADA